jgi:hypothetical protein
MQQNEPAEQNESILTEAERIVGGQRRLDYGPCTDSFEQIAYLWRGYLAGKTNLTGQDVAMMMALLKINRYKNGGTRDSLVDLCGYAACASQIDEDYARRAQP